MLHKILTYISLCTLVVALTSCTSTSKAPVRDALPNLNDRPTTQVTSDFHTVEPGDGLYRIGLRYGVSVADLAKWNNLNDANAIIVGQILRVTPPSTTYSSPDLSNNETIVTQPPENNTPKNIENAPQKTTVKSTVNWRWPTRSGAVIQPFSEQSRGISIDGKLGDPIFAAADGTVVFAGSSVPGLGNLIILQHNKDYLSAYAHNKTLRVKENQKVKAGDTIAEMGSSDTNMVKLHFEIREKGKAVNPLNLLPKR